MNILHISSARTWRGGENQIFLLIQGLSELGIRSVVMCPNRAPLGYRIASSDLECPVIHYKKRAGLSLRVPLEIRNIASSKNIDIVHVHDAHATNYAFIASIFGMRHPIVVTRRVDFCIKKSTAWKLNHRAISAIACVSNKVKEVLAASGIEGEKLQVIHSGVKLQAKSKTSKETLNSFRIPLGKKVVGFIGALVDHKDPLTFIQMADHLVNHMEQDHFHFIMVGDIEELGISVRRMIEDLDLSTFIEVIGFQEDMSEIWPRIDIIAVTSTEEGLGTVILEAFDWEIPVVSTDAGGISDIVTHQETGLLAPIKEYKTLAKHIYAISQSRDLGHRLTARAKAEVLRYDYRIMASKYRKLYKQVL